MGDTWNVRYKSGTNIPITWGGKPIHYRINWSNLNDERRLRIRNALENMAPKIGSGLTNDGQTSQTPGNAQEAYDLAPGTLYIYAKNFEENPLALAYTDVKWMNGKYVGGVIIFNKLMYTHPTRGNYTWFAYSATHEVGHVGGLLHCNAQWQIMSDAQPYVGTQYQSGDLFGLGVLKAARFD